MPSIGVLSDTGLTDFLKEISVGGLQPDAPRKVPAPLFVKNKKQLLLIGGGILGVLVLALAVWSLSGDRSVPTADGKKPKAMAADVKKGWQNWPADAPPPAIAATRPPQYSSFASLDD